MTTDELGRKFTHLKSTFKKIGVRAAIKKSLNGRYPYWDEETWIKVYGEWLRGEGRFEGLGEQHEPQQESTLSDAVTRQSTAIGRTSGPYTNEELGRIFTRYAPQFANGSTRTIIGRKLAATVSLLPRKV